MPKEAARRPVMRPMPPHPRRPKVFPWRRGTGSATVMSQPPDLTCRSSRPTLRVISRKRASTWSATSSWQ